MACSTTEIEHLPDLILSKIFDFLNVKSLVNCRMVSKRWRSRVNEIKLKELVLNFQQSSCNRNWSFTDDEIAEDSMINNFDLREIHLIPFELTELKRLKICRSFECFDVEANRRRRLFNKFYINRLNQFVQLEVLELPSIALVKDERLSLPALKALFIVAIDDIRQQNAKLILNTPKLNRLTCLLNLNRLNVLYPKSIRQLHLSLDADDLERFENVERFVSDFPQSIRDAFDQLPNLKQLDLVKNADFFSYYNEVKLIMNQLIERKRLAKRDELKIYFLDTLLDDRPFEDCVSPNDYDVFEIDNDDSS